MPAEAIHLSALQDSLQGHATRSFLRARDLLEGARLGAIFVDLPYFARFPLKALRYLMKIPVGTGSAWGDAFHQRRPVAVGKGFLRGAAALCARRSSRAEGEKLLAFALGYFSHLAVDAAIHPSVNRMAEARAAALGDRPMRQHNEIEKFQSILFHQERLGFDFMGRPELASYIQADPGPLVETLAISQKIQQAIQLALGEAPTLRELRRWMRGYQQYTLLLASRLGKTIAPEADKERMRPEVFENPEDPFLERFEKARRRSQGYLEAALTLFETPATEDFFDRIVPEGSIDDPPYPTD